MSKSYKLSGTGNYIDSTGIVHNKTALSNYLYSKSNNLTTTSTGNVLDAYQGYVLNNKIKGTVLYSNSTGTTGTISLSDNISNYDLIEITHGYLENSGHTTYVTGEGAMDLANEFVYTQYAQYRGYIKFISLKERTITVDIDRSGYLYAFYNTTDKCKYEIENSIYIFKVVGYKYQ